MLDFAKLMSQLENVGTDALTDGAGEDLVNTLQEVFHDACENSGEFAEALRDSESFTFWPLAYPLETFGELHQLQPYTGSHTVVAVDGSQIMPSHHEVYSCYLINLGKAIISYGDKSPVVLESTPLLFHNMEDLYPLMDKRRVHVDDLFVGMERNLLELSRLRDLSLEAANSRALPLVALVDGSLIQWSLDKMPENYQSRYVERLTMMLDSFRQNRIPLIGYISHSRSSDLVNALRVWHCPYDFSDCRRLCGHLHEEEYPCSTIWPSTDRQAIAPNLPRHNRGAIFASGVLKGPSIPDHDRVCFTYLNVGQETARIEMPRWLAEDSDLRDTALQMVLAQTNKGAGYPICLAEAHNMAVIRAADRSKFFQLVSRHLIELGIAKVRVSPKETGKRRGIV